MSHPGLRGILVALTVLATACSGVPKLASVLRSPSPSASEAVPIREPGAAWPGAFFSVRLPDNGKDVYALQDALDATHLVMTSQGRDKITVNVLDTAAGTLSEIATVRRAGTLSRVWVGERYVVLVTLTRGFPSQHLWAVSLLDGDVTEVKGVGDGMASPAMVVGDTLYYPAPVDDVVYRISLPGGGTPEPVAGSQGLFLVSWPWASDRSSRNVYPADESSDTMTRYLRGVLGNPLSARNIASKRNQTRLANLETGEVRPVVAAPGVTRLRCGPDWCRGRLADGRDVVQRPNGTGLAALSGHVVDGDGPVDRFFITVRQSAAPGARIWDTLVYDARTGTTVLGPRFWEIGGSGTPVSLFSRASHLIACRDCDASVSGLNLWAIR